MRLKFKHQKFQKDAAKAVVDVFKGQPKRKLSYLIDKGDPSIQSTLLDDEDFTGFKNFGIIPELADNIILENINKVQSRHQINLSEKLEGKFNLTIEMETGVGKTYTYIKTMYELNKHYGWSKYIIVVPSIAIREGVYKSFQLTEDHFSEEYGKKIRYFIYDSSRLTDIDRFASDEAIHVMIINSQAFNASGKDARRIYMKLDEFRSRRPIDIIAKTNPIVIIDEPQSVEGAKTRERLEEFNALMTLRYSATHKADSIYNMIYRLDAMEAYNKKLVKKIEVKGISQKGSTASHGFIYLEGINLSKKDPTASLHIDYKGKSGVRKKVIRVNEGDNLYYLSNELEQYKVGYTVKRIDGRGDSIELLNGRKIYAGDVVGDVSEDAIRRLQIRETILSHLQKEKGHFHKGIKVLSLFFIDEVAKYKQYDEDGNQLNGEYAEVFEQEYEHIVSELKNNLDENDEYFKYLGQIDSFNTHAGYFSIDNKGNVRNSSKSGNAKFDESAYNLIMKNKELLLDRDPIKSPVRFIFSHSALKEGWDNPNVFQICTLKQSTSEVRKRQEVGRGLRLCVNKYGERMDTTVLGDEVHNINMLTVIASESYDKFAKGLQEEIAEAISYRPTKITQNSFKDLKIKTEEGSTFVIDDDLSMEIHYELVTNEYIDKKGLITQKYYDDKKNGLMKLSEELLKYKDEIIRKIDSVNDPNKYKPLDARKNNVELSINKDKYNSAEFKSLWKKINMKSYYKVVFKEDELINNSIRALNDRLRVSRIQLTVESGVMDNIKSKQDLEAGKAFNVSEKHVVNNELTDIANSSVKYDLIGKLIEETGLTRRDMIRILTQLNPEKFELFKVNPEDFIIQVSKIINEEKATAIIQHITYNCLDEKYSTRIFTEPTIKGKLDENAMKTNNHIYNHLIYDSKIEKEFARDLDVSKNVSVYVKLPSGFHISTPVGKYNPDWAIAFKEGDVKHVYFVAETKGSLDSLELRKIEESKIHCAKEHFKAISGDNVVYDVVDSYDKLMEIVRG